MYQKSAVYLGGPFLLGSILKTTKSPPTWIHEVLDPQSSPVTLGEERTELASMLLKTHPSVVEFLVMVGVSHSGFRTMTVSVPSPGRGLTRARPYRL